MSELPESYIVFSKDERQYIEAMLQLADHKDNSVEKAIAAALRMGQREVLDYLDLIGLDTTPIGELDDCLSGQRFEGNIRDFAALGMVIATFSFQHMEVSESARHAAPTMSSAILKVADVTRDLTVEIHEMDPKEIPDDLDTEEWAIALGIDLGDA